MSQPPEIVIYDGDGIPEPQRPLRRLVFGLGFTAGSGTGPGASLAASPTTGAPIPATGSASAGTQLTNG